MNNYCTIYLVRHGESQGNVDFAKWIQEVQRTKLGSDLTDLGRKQAKDLAGKLKNVKFDAIFSSHLRRAHSTAKIIAQEKKLAVIAKEALQERRKGNFGGKSVEELKKIDHLYGDVEKLTNDEIWKWRLFPDMESGEEALGRFITVLREIAISHPGKNVLVVSHGFIMRTLLVHLGFATFRELPIGTISNTGYIKLESDGVDFFIKETFEINKIKSS